MAKKKQANTTKKAIALKKNISGDPKSISSVRTSLRISQKNFILPPIIEQKVSNANIV